MELSAVVLQQASAQTNAALSVLKKNAEVEQKVAQLMEEAVQSSARAFRGRSLDITV